MKKIIARSIKHGIKEILVDDEDYEFLNRWKWHISEGKRHTFYAMRQETNVNGSQYHVSMHRVIMGVYDPKIEVDHRDHNGLNNQKSNLRNCVNGENRKNRRKMYGEASSIYIGVHLRIRKRRGGGLYKTWLSTFGKTRKTFPHTEQGEIDAGRYYDELAKKHNGEFANLNFK